MEQLITLALLIEAVITTINWLIEGKFNWQRITAVAVSVITSILAQVDIFSEVGLPLILPYVGSGLTGLIVSRGANVVYDLYKSIQSFASLAKVKTPIGTTVVTNIPNKSDLPDLSELRI